MESTLELTVQNNETNLPKGRRQILAFSSPLLVPCSVTEEADDFKILFDIKGLTSCEDTKRLKMQEKYRLLHNCAALKKLTVEFEVNLNPYNVYLDVNLLPKLLKRDIGSTNEETFLAEYKALIGTVLVPKYSFGDYYNGGADLYRKNKKLRDICGKDTVDDVADALLEWYDKELEKMERRMIVVRKSTFRIFQFLTPLLVFVSLGCIALAAYLHFIRLPFQDKLIRGNNAYLNSDFLLVQDELGDIAVSDLPNESKYILARSYVVSESLNSDQKENILNQLAPKTDTVYFDYWIELGRLSFDEAIDAAQRIGDDQLLLLAYIKYEAFLETDTYTLSGNEKAEKIRDLQSKIESLSSELETERDEASEVGEVSESAIAEIDAVTEDSVATETP